MSSTAEQHTRKRLALAAPGAPDFYEQALFAQERPLYRLARAEQGLEGEVALLRLRLHALLHDRAELDPAQEASVTAQVLRIVDLLVKALRAHGAGTESERAALERALDEEALLILRAAGNAARESGHP